MSDDQVQPNHPTSGGTSPLRTDLPAPPFFLVAAFLVLVVGTWVPLVFFARGRFNRTEEPRIHFVQDMDNQVKYKAEDTSEVFADQRAMRMPIGGTVARGKLDEDDHYLRGYSGADGGKAAGGMSLVGTETRFGYYDDFPKQMPLSEATLMRGQQRFNIYCAPCHGQDGYGHGAVDARAVEKQESNWVTPANLNSDLVRSRPVGHIYNTVTNGIRKMAGYGSQISSEDRWAIVAYVRALQTSQHAAVASLPPDAQGQLK